MITREVAWRVFSAEYNSSNKEFKGEGERAPTYVITPLGAMVNRVFIVGVLTDRENIGTPQEPLWRARVADPTGTFYVSAGQYQPEAALALSKIEPPAFVAIVGKSRTYSPEEGTMYVSVRPEKIVVVDGDLRDYWVLETAQATLKRIAAMEDAKEMEAPSVEELVKLGHSKALSEGVIRSLEHYKDLDLARYKGVVIEALEELLPERRAEPVMPEVETSSPDEIEVENEDVDKEEQVLQVIDKLDKGGKGAPWDGIVQDAAKIKIEKTELEEIINSLLDKGLIYEPVLGKMKRI